MTELTDEERRAMARMKFKAWAKFDDLPADALVPWQVLRQFDIPCQSPEITRLDSYRPYGT